MGRIFFFILLGGWTSKSIAAPWDTIEVYQKDSASSLVGSLTSGLMGSIGMGSLTSAAIQTFTPAILSTLTQTVLLNVGKNMLSQLWDATQHQMTFSNGLRLALMMYHVIKKEPFYPLAKGLSFFMSPEIRNFDLVDVINAFTKKMDQDAVSSLPFSCPPQVKNALSRQNAWNLLHDEYDKVQERYPYKALFSEVGKRLPYGDKIEGLIRAIPGSSFLEGWIQDKIPSYVAYEKEYERETLLVIDKMRTLQEAVDKRYLFPSIPCAITVSDIIDGFFTLKVIFKECGIDITPVLKTMATSLTTGVLGKAKQLGESFYDLSKTILGKAQSSTKYIYDFLGGFWSGAAPKTPLHEPKVSTEIMKLLKSNFVSPQEVLEAQESSKQREKPLRTSRSAYFREAEAMA